MSIPRAFLAVYLLLVVLTLHGCWLTDRVPPAEVAKLEEILRKREADVAGLREVAAGLRNLANATGHSESIAAAGAAERALAFAEKALPEIRAQIAQLKEAGGPRWELLLAGAWPFIGPLIRTIPGVGGVAGPVADVLWAGWRTKRQKEQDDAMAAAAHRQAGNSG